MNRFSIREHAPSILVATLSSAFGIALLQVASDLAVVIRADDDRGSSGAVQAMLKMTAIVFIVISTYVGTVVTANTFATIIAGRTRTIALMRLIGATARSQRRAVAREGLLVGVIGGALGAVVATALTTLLVAVGVAVGFMPALQYTLVEPELLIPLLAVVLTTWLASWVGSRRVLAVSPMQATGAAQEASLADVAGHRGRNRAAVILFCVGTALLVLGMLVGLSNPGGVLIGLVGGVLSFTGVILGSQLVMPPALRLVGRMLGSSSSARLAAENAVRYPERSARTTIGIVIGVTLITMFAVATGSFSALFSVVPGDPQQVQGTQRTLLIVVVVFSVLIGFSALIAAVGLVNNLSLSVMQRTRELGLLRALGFTARQLRGMILAGSGQLTTAAVLVGLLLGTFYGWAGAQSLLARATRGPALVVPAIPLWLLVAIVVGAAVLTVVASIAPTRRATRITPVAALTIE